MKDILGVDLEVGQMVAFADRDGNVARLRAGVISNVNEAEGKVTIEWVERAAWEPVKSIVSVNGVYIDRPRICVVDKK